MRPVHQKRAVLAVVSVILVLVLGAAFRHTGTRDLLLVQPTKRCGVTFAGYEASAWEKRWLADVDVLQHSVCSTMLNDSAKVDVWMTGAARSFKTRQSLSQVPDLSDSDVFSRMRYYDSCARETLDMPIEPLVGLLRHPASHPQCPRPDRPDFIDKQHTPRKSVMENKGYMLIQPWSAATVDKLYPGQKLLFDLGTGRYNSGSLPWFLRVYGDRGIQFDEIHAWEKTPIPPEEYWAQAPANLSDVLHFRNEPCPPGPDDPGNPLNVLRRLYRRGDYVVFKLDIDNEKIEQQLMAQIDRATADMITEFFYEQHFDVTEMQPFFGSRLKTKLGDVIAIFTRLRQWGLRIHYWP